MTLWHEIQPYLDPETGLLMAPDGGKDNLQLYTAYLLREMYRNGEHCAGLSNRLSGYNFVNSSLDGLYRRGPNQDNSIDNYTGILWAGPYTAYLVLDRWLTCNAFFDCDTPVLGELVTPWDCIITGNFNLLRYWFGRFIGFKAYLVACAGDEPNLFDRLPWCLSVYWGVHTSKGASDPLLMSLQVDKMELYCPRTVSYWRRHYSIRDLYAEYFGKDHPLTRSRS